MTRRVRPPKLALSKASIAAEAPGSSISTKPKPRARPGFAIAHEFHRNDRAVIGEKALNLFFGSGPRKVADIDRLSHEINLIKKDTVFPRLAISKTPWK